MAEEKSALEQLQEEGQKRKGNNRLVELKFDPITRTYTYNYPLPGPGGGGRKVTFTEQELKSIPGAQIGYDVSNNPVNARVGIKEINRIASAKNETEVKVPETKYYSATDPAPTSGQLESPQFAYKQGIELTKEVIAAGTVVQDPLTGRITFVTPTETAQGEPLEAGGTANQTFAVVIPGVNRFGQAVAMVYDAVTAQEDIIKSLNNQGSIADYKQMLAEKGFYRLSGFNQVQIEQSLSQGDTDDSFFRTALSGFLYQYSIQNFSNFKNNQSLFEYDDYIKNFKPDYTTEDAYVPSEISSEDALRSAYLQYVGRVPTDLEMTAFKNAVESYAMSNPRRSGISDAAGMGVTQEGFTPDQLERFAQEYALSTPEAEQYGEGVGGYNMFNNAINSLVKDLEDEVSVINKPVLGTRPDGL
jgi:hypothetical protein